MASFLHLAGRFFSTLWPFGPSRSDDRWARSFLLDSEIDLWTEMWRPDRRHAIGVARRVEDQLGEGPDRAVMAAALLHDVGKVDARLRTYGRVAATLSGKIIGHDDDTIRAWTRTQGFTRRVGLYLRHPGIGGDRLALAGSDPLTVAWAREHHQPAEEWTIPMELATVLKAADGD